MKYIRQMIIKTRRLAWFFINLTRTSPAFVDLSSAFASRCGERHMDSWHRDRLIYASVRLRRDEIDKLHRHHSRDLSCILI
jgi:hypothetical protein